MSLSKNVPSATVTASNTAASFGLTSQSGTLGSQSELSTGDYNFSILDKATSDVLGKTNLISNSNKMTLDHSAAESNSANAMSSGQYSLKITGVAGSNISYDLTKIGDSSFGTNGTLSVTGANLAGGSTPASVVFGSNIAPGIPFTSGPAVSALGHSVGQTPGAG
jgi:hypothetical protein